MSQALRSALRFLLVNSLPAELFDPNVSLDVTKRLFRNYVKLVEVENHSYCNRVCWFCPNATLDRRSQTIPIDPGLFRKILENLAEVEYSQTVVWARYHEPMADESLYPNLALTRKWLPKAFLTIHTNGDYLNRESVAKLEETGLNQVRINLYVANGQPYNSAAVDKMVEQIEGRTGLTMTDLGPERGGYHLVGSRLNLPVNIPDFTIRMSSRGGLLVQVSGLQEYRRTSACLSPLQHVVIDYNGIGVLCCQVRSDANEHKDACIADLNRPGYTLFHFYRELSAARLALVNSGVKQGVCTTCTINEGGPYRWGRTAVIARPLGLLPGYSDLVSSKWEGRKRRYDPEV
jgi:hypothetical protein